MREREVYPNAPIVLVAVEIRHALCDALEPPDLARAAKVLTTELPIRGEFRSMEIEFQAGPNVQASAQQQALPPMPRWTSRNKRTAITLRQDAIVVETTDYRNYERLHHLVQLGLEARSLAGHPEGIARIGLRYIDEIRVPNDGDGVPWGEWVDSRLLGPANVGHEFGLRPAGAQGASAFRGAEDHQLVIRYGPRHGHAVASNPEMRRPMPTPGAFFLLDIDSFWEPATDIPNLTGQEILDTVDRLHAPVRGVFEELITERLREEVLRNG